MVCGTSCIIAGAFIFSSVFLSMRVDKCALKDPLFQKISLENQKKYMAITNERRNIYLKGFGLGFIMSVLFLLISYKQGKKISSIMKTCCVLAISHGPLCFHTVNTVQRQHNVHH